MYFVYVLKLGDGKFYKGLTDNMERRICQHQNGECKSTKNYLPVELIHVEICSNRVEARQMEKYLKSGFGRECLNCIINLNV